MTGGQLARDSVCMVYEQLYELTEAAVGTLYGRNLSSALTPTTAHTAWLRHFLVDNLTTSLWEQTILQ